MYKMDKPVLKLKGSSGRNLVGRFYCRTLPILDKNADAQLLMLPQSSVQGHNCELL